MRLAPLAAAALLALAPGLGACATCRDGDIGSKNCLTNGGGLGSGVKAPIGVLENVVWVPYKLLVTPLTGMVQGGVGWYEETGEPVSATLTLPIGMALGVVTGAFNAFGQQPVFVERDDDLWSALAAPMITDQEVYKYTTPPRGRPLYADHAPVPQLLRDAEEGSLVAPFGYAQSYNERLRGRVD